MAKIFKITREDTDKIDEKIKKGKTKKIKMIEESPLAMLLNKLGEKKFIEKILKK